MMNFRRNGKSFQYVPNKTGPILPGLIKQVIVNRLKIMDYILIEIENQFTLRKVQLI